MNISHYYDCSLENVINVNIRPYVYQTKKIVLIQIIVLHVNNLYNARNFLKPTIHFRLVLIKLGAKVFKKIAPSIIVSNIFDSIL